MNRLRDALVRYVEEHTSTDAAHDLGHLNRVWRNATLIADREAPCDRTVLLAAAYLHDLVNLPKSHLDRAKASLLSAEKSTPLLRDLGLRADQIDATCHAIIAHSFSANVPPETLEARILQDADRIEALGAIGLARCFAISGALSRPLFHFADPFAVSRPRDDQTYAVDHFAEKLLRLPATMQTAAGRELANERAGVLRRYLDDLATELDVPVSGW